MSGAAAAHEGAEHPAEGGDHGKTKAVDTWFTKYVSGVVSGVASGVRNIVGGALDTTATGQVKGEIHRAKEALGYKSKGSGNIEKTFNVVADTAHKVADLTVRKPAQLGWYIGVGTPVSMVKTAGKGLQRMWNGIKGVAGALVPNGIKEWYKKTSHTEGDAGAGAAHAAGHDTAHPAAH